MDKQRLNNEIKVDMAVHTAEGTEIGTVAQVWPDVGVGESWGAVGSIPQREAEATDLSQYAFSESMPGEGDSYFRVQKNNGEDLYVPFAAVSGVEDQVVTVAVDEDSVPGMQWDVKPDFINIKSEPDSQAASWTR